jgi:hypothetical protein
LPSAHMSNERWVDCESLFQHACNRRSWTRLSMWLMCTSWRRNTFQYWSSCMSVCAWLIILSPCILHQILFQLDPLHFSFWYSPIAQSPWCHGPETAGECSHPLSSTKHLRETGTSLPELMSRVMSDIDRKRKNYPIVPWPHVPPWAAAIIETCTSTPLKDWWNLSRMSMTPFPLVWRIQRRERGASQSLFLHRVQRNGSSKWHRSLSAEP